MNYSELLQLARFGVIFYNYQRVIIWRLRFLEENSENSIYRVWSWEWERIMVGGGKMTFLITDEKNTDTLLESERIVWATDPLFTNE